VGMDNRMTDTARLQRVGQRRPSPVPNRRRLLLLPVCPPAPAAVAAAVVRRARARGGGVLGRRPRLRPVAAAAGLQVARLLHRDDGRDGDRVGGGAALLGARPGLLVGDGVVVVGLVGDGVKGLAPALRQRLPDAGPVGRGCVGCGW